MAFPFDIAGNEMANTVGGGLQYVVGQLVGSLLSFFLGPALAGTVMGFFIGILSGIFEDLSIFLQIGEIFEGLAQIGELIPQLISNPGLIWEMIKNSLFMIINKAFNFNPFGQGGYTLMQWVENITNLVGDFFDNWNVDDELLQGFISAKANLFNLAFTAAHMVGYIIQQIWVGGFLVIGKLNKAGDITGNLGKIAGKLKESKKLKKLGTFFSKVSDKIKSGLKWVGDKVDDILQRLGLKHGDEAITYLDDLVSEFGEELAEELAKKGDNMVKNLDNVKANKLQFGGTDLWKNKISRKNFKFGKHGDEFPELIGKTSDDYAQLAKSTANNADEIRIFTSMEGTSTVPRYGFYQSAPDYTINLPLGETKTVGGYFVVADEAGNLKSFHRIDRKIYPTDADFLDELSTISKI